jgi:hypothetical protein
MLFAGALYVIAWAAFALAIFRIRAQENSWRRPRVSLPENAATSIAIGFFWWVIVIAMLFSSRKEGA